MKAWRGVPRLCLFVYPALPTHPGSWYLTLQVEEDSFLILETSDQEEMFDEVGRVLRLYGFEGSSKIVLDFE